MGNKWVSSSDAVQAVDAVQAWAQGNVGAAYVVGVVLLIAGVTLFRSTRATIARPAKRLSLRSKPGGGC